MKKIKLSQGKYALVDDEDYDYLSKMKWYFLNGYARASSPKKHNLKNLTMHRVILNVEKGLEVDHINHNKVDNQKKNLRVCTTRENHYNTLKPITNKSGFKGVSWRKDRKKWEAQIRFKGKKKHLGFFESKLEAANMYNQMAEKFYGRFAHLNLIKQ